MVQAVFFGPVSLSNFCPTTRPRTCPTKKDQYFCPWSILFLVVTYIALHESLRVEDNFEMGIRSNVAFPRQVVCLPYSIPLVPGSVSFSFQAPGVFFFLSHVFLRPFLKKVSSPNPCVFSFSSMRPNHPFSNRQGRTVPF